MPLQYGKEGDPFGVGWKVALVLALFLGGMAERLKAAVLKTAKGESPS